MTRLTGTASVEGQPRPWSLIRKRLSPLAMPQHIEFADSLPRTRSGKILRRMLKAKEWGLPIGDLSTLEDD